MVDDAALIDPALFFVGWMRRAATTWSNAPRFLRAVIHHTAGDGG
jgi:hypothetical protein